MRSQVVVAHSQRGCTRKISLVGIRSPHHVSFHPAPHRVLPRLQSTTTTRFECPHIKNNIEIREGKLRHLSFSTGSQWLPSFWSRYPLFISMGRVNYIQRDVYREGIIGTVGDIFRVFCGWERKRTLNWGGFCCWYQQPSSSGSCISPPKIVSRKFSSGFWCWCIIIMCSESCWDNEIRVYLFCLLYICCCCCFVVDWVYGKWVTL